MLFSCYQYVKQTTILILLILGALIGKGYFLERGTYFENLTFGGALIKECARIRSFMVLQNTIKVFMTSFKLVTRPKLILFNL